jgi:hypothetical protein
MAIMKYAGEDTRIDLIRKFLGIGEDKIRREVLDYYLILMKCLPISFFKLFDDEYNNYVMNPELCFEIYFTKLHNMNLVSENKEALIKFSKIYDSNGEPLQIREDRRLDLFLVIRFLNRSYNFISDITDLQKQNIKEEQTSKLVEAFQNANKEFKLSNDKIFEIVQKYFSAGKAKFNIDNLLNYFNQNKISFKLKIIDFLDISVNSIVQLFNVIERKIVRLFDEIDSKKVGLIYFREFEELMKKIMPVVENKWKIAEYFK